MEGDEISGEFGSRNGGSPPQSTLVVHLRVAARSPVSNPGGARRQGSFGIAERNQAFFQGNGITHRDEYSTGHLGQSQRETLPQARGLLEDVGVLA